MVLDTKNNGKMKVFCPPTIIKNKDLILLLLFEQIGPSMYENENSQSFDVNFVNMILYYKVVPYIWD